MHAVIRNVLAVAGLAVATQASAQVTFFEQRATKPRRTR